MERDVELEIEVTVSPEVKLRVRGSELGEVLRAVREAYEELSRGQRVAVPAARQQAMPRELVERLPRMSYRDVVLVLLYYEGPLSKERINQRSRELGKEVTKEWLDKKLYDELKGMVASVESGEGPKSYKLTEYGRQKAEEILRAYGILK
ncbi:MAG: hypothetical protein N3H32_02910 [Nitrososphaeria archaeon]|nr:hypothetical protein [Nitrososphaeria archaeon]MDW8043896.1 hypothetical protein [Nitrososphaerota archaeon]